MRNQFKHQNNTKVVVYAVVLLVLLAVGFIVLQDIQVPTEHQTQEIDVDIEK